MKYIIFTWVLTFMALIGCADKNKDNQSVTNQPVQQKVEEVKSEVVKPHKKTKKLGKYYQALINEKILNETQAIELSKMVKPYNKQIKALKKSGKWDSDTPEGISIRKKLKQDKRKAMERKFGKDLAEKIKNFESKVD